MSVRRVELGGRWEAAGRPVRGALCHLSEVDVSSLLRGLVSGRPGQDRPLRRFGSGRLVSVLTGLGEEAGQRQAQASLTF